MRRGVKEHVQQNVTHHVPVLVGKTRGRHGNKVQQAPEKGIPGTPSLRRIHLRFHIVHRLACIATRPD